MSWCDKLASVPLVGAALEPNFRTSSAILDDLLPHLNELARDRAQKIQIDRQETFSISFSSEDGFSYSFEPTKIIVAFTHKLLAKPTSGGLPVVDFTSRSAVYTKLLDESVDLLLKIISISKFDKLRRLERFGIVTNTSVKLDDAPPGAQKALDYLRHPWSAPSESFGYRFSAPLKESEFHKDRCIINLSCGDNPDDLVNVSLDWQRLFERNPRISEGSIRNIANACKKDALSYFEEFAVGENFL